MANIRALRLEVLPDPVKLSAVGLSTAQIKSAIEANNRNDGAGRLGEGDEVLLVRTEGSIKTQDDLKKMTAEQKAALKLGIWDQGPTTDWVSSLGLIEQAQAFPIMSGDPKQSPAHIVEAELMKGNINLTFLWGPYAGYLQHKLKDAGLVVIPLNNEPGLKFDYQIAMAVRHGDDARRKQLAGLIAKNQPEIDKILAEYGVPQLPLEHKAKHDDDDD